jgi:hypothetical protein
MFANMTKHDCRQLNQFNELVFICSRCGKCYECKHKLIWMDEAEKYMWKCPDGKLRPVINDAKLKVS